MGRHHHPTQFYDSANPHNVPSGVLAGVYVAAGSFVWPQEEVDRMRGVFGISESGDAQDAKLARCIAIEPGAGSPDQAPAFLDVRIAHGHHDGMCYVNESNWEATEQACLDNGHDPEWWVAVPGESIAECRQLRSPIRHKEPVAAQNFWGQGYDLSVLLGNMTFTPPHKFHAVHL